MAAGGGVSVRPMHSEDLAETLDMWVAAWQAAYPHIDFAARREWAKERIAELERSGFRSLVAARQGHIVGAVLLNPETGYLDQIVVATPEQGRGVGDVLLAAAQHLSPAGLDLQVNRDNARAIRFYEKHGFVAVGEDVNPRSGAPTHCLRWRP
ncbi:MAG TPA: GNAT family N-acetyltransferase [Xanthobacteraceae bacterium]